MKNEKAHFYSFSVGLLAYEEVAKPFHHWGVFRCFKLLLPRCLVVLSEHSTTPVETFSDLDEII